jgi:AhpD family alkylhydroperoxidase
LASARGVLFRPDTEGEDNAMKTLAKWFVVLGLLVAPHLAAVAVADEHADAQAAYQEMKGLFGIVPTFMKQFPEASVAAAWDQMKAVQLGPTALAGKYKELVGLAVSAQIPCRYCIYFHTEAAKLNGATEKEIKEALVVASLTREFSTVLNGMQVDEATFRSDLAKAFAYAGKPHPAAAPIAVTDAASAAKDVERTFGFVPGFLRMFPDADFAAAWREYKGIFLSETALPPKVRDLIGLGVAAQIPCRYCIVAHTEAAKLEGATDAEIRDAVASAAMTRHWSTFLNGAMVDEATFRKETDQIVKYLRVKMASR